MRFRMRGAVFESTPGSRPINCFDIIEEGDEVTALEVDKIIEALGVKNRFNKITRSLFVLDKSGVVFEE